MDSELVDTIKRLEQELLDPAVRHDEARLSELLHSDFVEVGKSGRRWTKASCIAALLEQTEFDTSPITSFALELLHDDQSVVIAHWTMPGVRRMSIWTNHTGSWQIRYHQGTRSDEC